jgi:hypothetical protein
MGRKFISIVGSVDEGAAAQRYDPPVRDAPEARAAAELIGLELAKRGYGITVYAGDYIERDVVRGFVQGTKEEKSIHVLFASGQKGPEGFAEYATRKAMFDRDEDDSSDWEMSFYGSLADADGIVLIGGGRSSLIVGVLALTYRIPILALKAYGGSGEKIWKTIAGRRGLATSEEAKDLSQKCGKGDTDLVAKWVSHLESQSTRRRKQRRWSSGVHWAIAAIILAVLWLLALPLGHCLLPTRADGSGGHPTVFLFLLFLAPMLSGASGATVRMLLPGAGVPTINSMALGMTAGAVAGVLYVISHLIADPKPHNFAVLVISVAFGFIAGLTFDKVFRKLESADVVRTEILSKV